MKKAYKALTPNQQYNREKDSSRISVAKQADEYARFVVEHGIKTLYLYPEKKSPLAASNKFRLNLAADLGSIYWQNCTIVEVNPEDFL